MAEKKNVEEQWALLKLGKEDKQSRGRVEMSMRER